MIREKLQKIQVKRLVILNLPYFFIFYVADKGSWLYRHCLGESMVQRLGVMLVNFRLAFLSWLPSVALQDLAVGVLVAGALKLVVYYRSKNAKKFRQGVEYALGGQVVHISPTSKDYINPMDINMDYSDDDNPLGVKSDFVLSLCELIMGSRDGIEAEEKSVIDRCLPLVYQKYFADPKPENMPVLGDLYDCLRKQKEPQAQRIATALEIYVNGSLKVFNHRTNVELNNRIVCFDIKELGKQLKKIGMLIVQDQVWNRVTINRGIKSTRYYIDEFHLLLKEEQTAAYSVEIWKRFRKWGGIPSGITQNIKDLLASREIENIFENSDFILMLNQAAGDRQILAKQLNISPYQLSYVTNSGEGEGLLFYGTTIIPFKDKFDKNLKLYSLMTTKPEEVEKREKEMEAEKHEGNR